MLIDRELILHSDVVHPFFFFFNDTATTEIYTLSLHDALPITLPVLETIRLSSCGVELPMATLTRTCPGATVRAAAEGGLLISLSSLQVVRRTANTHAAAPIAQRLVTGRLRDL